jgi:hypothetical protein
MRTLFRPLFSLLLLPFGFLACVGDDPVVATPTDAATTDSGTPADAGATCPAMPPSPSKDSVCAPSAPPAFTESVPAPGEYLLTHQYGNCTPKLGARINLTVETATKAVTLVETRSLASLSISLRRTLDSAGVQTCDCVVGAKPDDCASPIRFVKAPDGEHVVIDVPGGKGQLVFTKI